MKCPQQKWQLENPWKMDITMPVLVFHDSVNVVDLKVERNFWCSIQRCLKKKRLKELALDHKHREMELNLQIRQVQKQLTYLREQTILKDSGNEN